jgi:hypothetical protein
MLVAVVLISTVIVTYSTIRNSQTQDHPQVLSAIDETNLAIRQILGFTVGYYGSVLKVTGNLSYAKELAIRYLRSGLVNIGNMHPDWGASFHINTSNLYTNWFEETSFSTGSLIITYDLIGLGIAGVTYETSCHLTVDIGETVSGNQIRLMVTKNGGEPLVDLGRRNFRFYNYSYENLAWMLVPPTSEPVAFANGTYELDVPSGVDPYSYLIQVEDPRGLIVVASSFSHYICRPSWNPIDTAYKYAVNGSTPEILGTPDQASAAVIKGDSCTVYDYENGTGTINQVYFYINYHGNVSGTLDWYYRLDGGSWNSIGTLIEGGNATSPLTATYNATDLRASWTWSNLNNTDIQFRNNDVGNSEDAYVDSIYTRVSSQTGDYYSPSLQTATVAVELLQNGSMRWLGQNLDITTEAKPFPPIPVKAIRVNQTINGLNQEIPFQVEDWASEYRIPLGMSSNASVFGSRSMLVFTANQNVSKVTIWWNGSDMTTQTPYAYVNRYFTGDDPDNGVLTNGILTLDIDTSGSYFQIRSTLGSAESTARFMRVNNEWSVYGADPAYVIHHGVVRDIIHQEAEWSGGADSCPNFYAHIVLTLPANATYFTYHLRMMFLESIQNRTITDLCPIRITTTNGLRQTENGTLSGYPIISNITGTFYNFSASIWEHHWSQFISETEGAGIMFTDDANRMLYFFDSIAGDKTGALRVSTSSGRMIELLPVKMVSAEFQYALDITWHGAVVTFDDTTPIYYKEDGKETGLWIIVEHPPRMEVATES